MNSLSIWMAFAVWIAANGSMLGAAGPQSKLAEFELESYLQVSAPFQRSALPAGAGQQVELTNLSQQGITAFSVETRVEFDDGTSSRHRQTEDFAVTEWYQQDPSLAHKAGILHPGQAKRLAVSAPSKPGVKASSLLVKVVAIVFEDRSAVGDKEVLEDIFRGREARQLVRHHWLQRLDEVLSMSLTESQLRARLSQFQAVLRDKSETYGNERVSSASQSASTQQKAILQGFDEAVSLKSWSDLLKRLETLRSTLRQDFNVMKRHVTHDVESMPVPSR